MNFMEAVSEMRKGKKVKRFGRPIIGFYTTKTLHDEYGGDANFTIEDFEATDWEVVDEDKDWNLAKKELGRTQYDFERHFNPEDVKKCRDLILKDLEKLSVNERCNDIVISTIIKKRFGDLQ